MPLELDDEELEALLDSGLFEMYEAVSIIFLEGDPLHLCERAFPEVETEEFGAVEFTEDLRGVGELNESLTLAANTVEFGVQNVSGFLATLRERGLGGATAVYANIVIDAEGAPRHIPLLSGEVHAPSDEDPDGKFTFYDDLSVPGPVVAYRACQQHCTNPKLGGPGCDSASGGTCDRTADGANGCTAHLAALRIVTPVPAAEKGNVDSFQGFRRRNEQSSVSTVADPGGAVDEGRDFNSYLRAVTERGAVWRGQHEVPEAPAGDDD